MRFVFAIVCFVIAAVMIGTGVAQKTIFLPPSEVVASVTIDSAAPVTIIDSKTLTAFPHYQTLTIGGAKTAYAAYGRTLDVKGWIGDASYNVVSYDSETRELRSKLVEGTEKTVPSLAGSDLWLAEFSDPLHQMPKVKVPAPSAKQQSISFIIVSDGTAPAPSKVSLSWPVNNSTPWVGPLLLGGGAVLIIGLGLLLWAIGRVRRARGPRRRPQKMPKLPKQPRYKPERRKPIPAGTRGRRSTRTSMIAVPIAVASVIALGGCSAPASITPDAAAATPAETAVVAASDTPPPAVTQLQAERIIKRVADVATAADAALDAKQLDSRFAGAALTLRTADYAIRKADPTEAATPAIPTNPLIVLPQQNDKWPRTVFAVVDNAADKTAPTIALMLVQDDPRSQYKVHYAMNLEPGVSLPTTAATSVGAPKLDPDSAFQILAPANVASAYGDILSKDTASASYGLFDATGDELRPVVGLAAQIAAQKKLPKTAKLTFSNAPGAEPVIVLSTIDGGAIVATELDETQTVKPVEAGAAVNAPKSIKALSGKAVSSTGITAVYGDQLLFYVPANTNSDGSLIRLLGYGQGLISASELPKK